MPQYQTQASPGSGALSRLPCNLPAAHFQHSAGSWRSHRNPAVTLCIYSLISTFHGYKEGFGPERMPLCHGFRIKRSKKTPERFGMGSYFPAFTQIRPLRVPPSCQKLSQELWAGRVLNHRGFVLWVCLFVLTQKKTIQLSSFHRRGCSKQLTHTTRLFMT